MDELGEARRSCTPTSSDADSVQAAIDHAQERFGALHVMVNNAGISGSPRRLMQDDLRDFDRVIAVDLYGVMVGTQRAARAMGPGGSIINITSIAGITPGPGFSTYRAAKAAVIHFSRSAAIEVGELGVRVNVIAPGNISTAINASLYDTGAVARRLQPLHRLGDTRDIANAAVYLASERAAQVTGTLIPVDGGTTAGPPPIDVGRHQGRRRRSRPEMSQTSLSVAPLTGTVGAEVLDADADRLAGDDQFAGDRPRRAGAPRRTGVPRPAPRA